VNIKRKVIETILRLNGINFENPRDKNIFSPNGLAIR
jgi:hypothetical protein